MLFRWILKRLRAREQTLPCRECHAQRRYVSVSEQDKTKMYCQQCGIVLRVVRDLDDETKEYLREMGE